MPADDGPTPVVDPTEIAALLALPPEDFVRARTARAKELRAEGRRAEAAAVGRLRKPVRLVWVLGELARRNPEVAEAAADVAAQVERAMAAGGGVRPLLASFRDVVGEVAGLADQLDGSVDRLQVGLALREVLADPVARRAWVGGWLLAMPGDEDDVVVADPGDELAARRAAKAGTGGDRGGSTGAADPAPPPPPKARRPRRTKDEVEADRARRAEEKARQAEERERKDAVMRAQAAQIVADAGLEIAQRNHEGAVTTLADLEERLAALQVEVATAREAIAAAEAEVGVAEARRESAHAALAALGAEPLTGGSGRR